MSDEIIGREAELERVSALLSPAAAPARSLVLSGEPGIGKSALWGAGVERALRGGYTVLAARPARGEAALAFATLRDLLERAAADIDELPAPQRAALRVALLLDAPTSVDPPPNAVAFGLLALLRQLAGRGPVVVAIDDLQWVDAETEAALAFALRRLDDEPVALLASMRAADLAAAGEALPATERCEVLPLGPVSLGALRSIALTRLGISLPRPLLRRVHEASGGNPFFGLELTRAVAEGGDDVDRALPVPERLEDLAGRRLDVLSPETLDALGLAARSTQATARLLAEVYGEEAAGAALGEAESAGVAAVEASGRVRFAHPLLAAAAEARTGAAARSHHARLAAATRAPEARARHLALASEGPAAEVAAELDRAAGEALARGAPATAAELARLGAALTPPDDPAGRTERELAEARYAIRAGDIGYAQERLAGLIGATAPGSTRAQAIVLLAELTPHEHRALGRALRAGPRRGRRRRSRDAGTRARRARDGLPARWRLRRRPARAGRRDRGGRARRRRAADHRDRRQRRLPGTLTGNVTPGLLERGVELERAALPGPAQYGPTVVLAMRDMYADRLDEARAGLTEALDYAIASGDEPLRAMTLLHLAELECRAGAFAAAEARARTGLELARTMDVAQWEAALLYVTALALAYRGELEAASALAEEGAAIAEGLGDALYRLHNRAVLGFIALSRGEAARAAELLLPLNDELVRIGHRELSANRISANAAEALAGAGRPDEARPLLAQLEEHAARGNRWAAAVGRRCEGVVALADGDAERAVELLEDALARHDGMPCPFERGRTLLALGAATAPGGPARPRARDADGRAHGLRRARRARLGGAGGGRARAHRRAHLLGRRADRDRAARRGAGRRGADEPRDRRDAVRDREDRRGHALARLPQARRAQPHGAGAAPARGIGGQRVGGSPLRSERDQPSVGTWRGTWSSATSRLTWLRTSQGSPCMRTRARGARPPTCGT